MEDVIDVLNYEVRWRLRSEDGFTGEIFFTVKRSSGGGVTSPVGYLIGMIEPGTELYSAYWKILLVIRDNIRYNSKQNRTRVFVKSAYASKFRYYIDRLSEVNRDIVRIDPRLPTALKDLLIQKELCTSPLTIEVQAGKSEYFYSNVEFDQE